MPDRNDLGNRPPDAPAVAPDERRVTSATVGTRLVLVVAALLATLAIGWFLRGGPEPRAEQASPPAAQGNGQRPRSIAGLPFTQVGEDAESTGLADDLHGALIAQLARLTGLEVRSRSSVLAYRDAGGGRRAIADQLKVDLLLQGSVQRADDRIVVDAQLIDARSDAPLWADTIEGNRHDLFALQADIAQRVVSRLDVELSPEERRALTEAPTRDHGAYRLYLQGMRVFTDSGLHPFERDQDAQRRRAADLLRQALGRDPRFVLAWAALTRVLTRTALDTAGNDYRGLADQALAAGATALALGGDMPEARHAHGAAQLQLALDAAGALRDLEYAARLMPNIASYQFTLGMAYRHNGRWKDYLRSARRALALEPTANAYAQDLLDALFALRQWDEYATALRAHAARHPDSYLPARSLAEWHSMQAGNLDALHAFLADAPARFPMSAQRVADLARMAMAQGDPAAALAALDQPEATALAAEAQRLRGDALRALGREPEAQAAYAAAREQHLKSLESERNPEVEAGLRAALAYLHARLDDAEAAREEIARVDALWGQGRATADAGHIWAQLLPAQAALGEFDAACARATVLVENPSSFPAQRLWLDSRIGELHGQECFRTLMRDHGVDVTREPLAINRAAGAANAGG